MASQPIFARKHAPSPQHCFFVFSSLLFAAGRSFFLFWLRAQQAIHKLATKKRHSHAHTHTHTPQHAPKHRNTNMHENDLATIKYCAKDVDVTRSLARTSTANFGLASLCVRAMVCARVSLVSWLVGRIICFMMQLSVGGVQSHSWIQ